jgi:hypothetical protein
VRIACHNRPDNLAVLHAFTLAALAVFRGETSAFVGIPSVTPVS